MASRGYKKYMKEDAQRGNPLIKIFIVSFFGMLLVFTFLINYMSQVVTVDTSIGDYQEQNFNDIEDKKIIDVNSLQMIQSEDQERNFTDIMQNNREKETTEQENNNAAEQQTALNESQNSVQNELQPDIIYKVYIGQYTSAEQAKVAKEIIQDSGYGLNPIVKCIGTNEYTLQVGIFKNKSSAEALLSTIHKNNLAGRIVQE